MGVEFSRFTDKGNPKLGQEEVRELVAKYPTNEALAMLLEVSESSNATTFLTTLKEEIGFDSRVRPTIRTLGTVTGRLGYTKPATQTVSATAGTRKVFRGNEDSHVLMSADLAQIQPRILAVDAKARRLLEQMRAGVDPYSAAAIEVAGVNYTKDQRKIAKRTILGTAFAAGINTLWDQARYTDGMLDVTRAQIERARADLKRIAPELDWFSKRLAALDCVKLESGRYVPNDPQRRYRNINSWAQGTERDIMMDRVLLLQSAGLEEMILGTQHDEIIFSVPREDVKDAAEVIRSCMEIGYKGIPTPSDIEIYERSWGDDIVSIDNWQG
jgi:DNA polymerase I-like protein with 3'-5' exonuclease and polymerase domains